MDNRTQRRAGSRPEGGESYDIGRSVPSWLVLGICLRGWRERNGEGFAAGQVHTVVDGILREERDVVLEDLLWKCLAQVKMRSCTRVRALTVLADISLKARPCYDTYHDGIDAGPGKLSSR